MNYTQATEKLGEGVNSDDKSGNPNFPETVESVVCLKSPPELINKF